VVETNSIGGTPHVTPLRSPFRIGLETLAGAEIAVGYWRQGPRAGNSKSGDVPFPVGKIGTSMSMSQLRFPGHS